MTRAASSSNADVLVMRHCVLRGLFSRCVRPNPQAPQARCHHLTTEELLQQQIDDLRMLLEMKDNLCRNTDERVRVCLAHRHRQHILFAQGTMLQDALVDAEQRAATAEATAEKLEAENRVHTTRCDHPCMSMRKVHTHTVHSISTLEHELAAMQQEQRNLQGYAQKLQMLVQELQRGKAQRTQV